MVRIYHVRVVSLSSRSPCRPYITDGWTNAVPISPLLWLLSPHTLLPWLHSQFCPFVHETTIHKHSFWNWHRVGWHTERQKGLKRRRLDAGGERRARGREGVGDENERYHGTLEVSLTILRNFADSLAYVDHVRPTILPREARVDSPECPKICIRDRRTFRGTWLFLYIQLGYI